MSLSIRMLRETPWFDALQELLFFSLPFPPPFSFHYDPRDQRASYFGDLLAASLWLFSPPSGYRWLVLFSSTSRLGLELDAS